MNKDKAYAGLFSVNFFVADIRNKEAVQEIVEKYSQESNYQTMATILWTQNEAPNEKETFIINGVVSTYEGSPVQDKAFALLLDARKRKGRFSLNNVNMKKCFLI